MLQLSFPDNATSLAGRDLATSGESLHAVAFTVRDLQAAADFLTSKGLSIAGRDDETILIDPATSLGASFRFTTLRLPGDPREAGQRPGPLGSPGRIASLAGQAARRTPHAAGRGSEQGRDT